jgi:hypothetical protein
MEIFNKLKYFGLALLASFLFSSCEKEVIATFDVNAVDALDESLIKNKTKNTKQYTSILYTTLFQEAISVSQLAKTERVVDAFGDKGLIKEVIISNYMNEPEVELPSDSFMRANPDEFIIQTYKTFYLRIPTEIEKSFFRNYIEANPNVTAEHVYISFASSDEYSFY